MGAPPSLQTPPASVHPHPLPSCRDGDGSGVSVALMMCESAEQHVQHNTAWSGIKTFFIIPQIVFKKTFKTYHSVIIKLHYVITKKNEWQNKQMRRFFGLPEQLIERT